jgi:hypothetical protein
MASGYRQLRVSLTFYGYTVKNVTVTFLLRPEASMATIKCLIANALGRVLDVAIVPRETLETTNPLAQRPIVSLST